MHYLQGTEGVLGTCVLSLDGGRGQTALAPCGQSLLFSLSSPIKLVSLPNKLCFYWWCQGVNLSATFINPDASWSKCLQPRLLSCKDGHLEMVLMRCKEWGGRLCHLPVPRQRATSFLLPRVVAIPQLADPNTTWGAQLQLSSLLPSSLSEDAKVLYKTNFYRGGDATGLSEETAHALKPIPMPRTPVYHRSKFSLFVGCFGKGQPVCQMGELY